MACERPLQAARYGHSRDVKQECVSIDTAAEVTSRIVELVRIHGLCNSCGCVVTLWWVMRK